MLTVHFNFLSFYAFSRLISVWNKLLFKIELSVIISTVLMLVVSIKQQMFMCCLFGRFHKVNEIAKSEMQE